MIPLAQRMRDKGGLVHGTVARPDLETGWREWLPGHADADLRDAQPCWRGSIITCLWCARHLGRL